MDTIDRIINEFYPQGDVSPLLRRFIKWVVGEKENASFYREISDKQGIDWINAVIEKLNYRVEVHNSDYNNIPASGPAVIISNHPTVVDGLSLISTVAKVRKDVKILANHLLQIIFPQIECISIGIRNMQGEFSRKQFKEISDHLKNGGVLVICPAGRLASSSFTGLKEAKWHAGFVQFAARMNAPVVPIHITGRNSLLYYVIANIWRALSNMIIMREIRRHQDRYVRVKIGSQIDLRALLDNKNTDYDKICHDIRSHLLLSGKMNKTLLPVLPPVALPEDRAELARALSKCKVLKTSSDGKVLYVYQYHGESYSPIINELGRLREISYRSIGAGTGNIRDNDIYDRDYFHVILWEPHDLEIIGSYRLIPANVQIEKKGLEGLYSHSLFKYQQDFVPRVKESMEVGRGFIQSQYQRTNALDILWKGIFSFVVDYPECHYLLGVLSIPQTFSNEACNLIVSFYQLYFSGDEEVCYPENRYIANDPDALANFSGDCFEKDWNLLNKKLRELGNELPWPYKQAAKWYSPGGSKLFCFIEDNHFNSIAGLNFCDISKLKSMYFSHYIARQSTDSVN